MRVLDLFSGIGGFSLGLERAGMETVAFCEYDEKCRQVLKKHWPDVHQYNDVRTLTAEQLINDGIDDIGLICGGYPCQPFSNAGKRQGAEDDRHLWPELFRLVKEIRPTWVLCENVAGHISMGLDSVLADLEGEAYNVQTFLIPACAVGAFHRRDRIWIVAHTESERCVKAGKSISRSSIGATRAGSKPTNVADASRQARGEDAANAGEPSHRARHNRKGVEIWDPEPAVGRVANGVSTELDETIRRITGEEINSEETVSAVDKFRREALRAMWESHQVAASSYGLYEFDFDFDFMPEVPHGRAFEGRVMGSRIEGDKGLRDMWQTVCAKPFDETQDVQQALLERIREAERDEKVAQGRVDRLKQLGNAVVPQVVEVIGRAIMTTPTEAQK